MQLKYQAELTGCEIVISRYYIPQELDLFRWVHCPIMGEDFEVQAKNPVNVKDIDISSATEEELLARVGKYALSCYCTYEAAREIYLEQKRRRMEKRARDGERFDKQKGGFIQKIHVTLADGLCSEPDETQHINFLEHEDTDMMQLLIDNPVKIS